MSFCNKCGKKLDEGSSFCLSCGAPAVTAEPAEAQPAAPAYQMPPPVYGVPPAYTRPMAITDRNTFINSYLVIVVFAAVFFIAIGYSFLFSPNKFFSINSFLNPRNLGMIFTQGIFLLGPIAFAAAVSTRAKGPDFSIGSVMVLTSSIIASLSMSSGSPILGIIVALLVSATIGLLNGAIITYLRVPAVIVTILTGVLIRAVSNLILNGQTLMADETIRAIAGFGGGFPLGGLIIFVITFAAAFVMIMLTKLGVPTYQRDKKPVISYMLAYVASALIASVAGIYMMARIGAASPLAGAGFEPFIVLVFACITGSRAMDNRFAPAVFAIAPVFLYAILSNILSIIGTDVFQQAVFGVIFAVIVLAAAYLSRRFSSSYNGD